MTDEVTFCDQDVVEEREKDTEKVSQALKNSMTQISKKDMKGQ